MEITSIASNPHISSSESGINFAKKQTREENKIRQLNDKTASASEKQTKIKADAEKELITGSAQDQQKLNKQELGKITKELNNFIDSTNTALSFRVDEESGNQMLIVYEAGSGKIIRQIPNDEVLEVFQQLKNRTLSFVEEFV